MNFTFSGSADSKEILLEGDFTFTDNETFRALLAELKSENPNCCVINLSQLNFMDSAGLSMLLLLKDVATNISCSLSLRSPQGQVGKMLRISRFGEEIPIE